MIEFGPLDALARDPTVTDVAITAREGCGRTEAEE